MSDRTFDSAGEAGCPSGLAPADAPGHARQMDPEAFVRREGEASKLTLLVRGAKCAGCLSKIEGALAKLPGLSEGRLNLSTGRLDVSWTGALTAREIADTVSGLGYGVSAFDTAEASSGVNREERRLLAAMGIAGFASANIMLLSVSVWAGHGEMGEATRQLLHAVSGAIAIPAVLYAGQVFFRSAWAALSKGHANMDVPISLALILALSVSVFETVKGGEHAYFDAAAMLCFFLLIGRFLDARLRRRAHAAAHQLAAMQGETATRLDPDGSARSVRGGDIRPGDLILLAAGERAIVDMELVEGSSAFDESLVTGESDPRPAGVGAKLLSGSINLTRPVTARALASADNSLLADMARMLEAGEQKRSRYRRIADRAVSLYVPLVHTTAALTLVGWLASGASVREAVMVAVSTLIITCPCALALAAPVVQVVAASRLFRKGVFLRSGDALERLAEVDHAVFDKTGTLTLGHPEYVPNETADAVLKDAAALARASRHPMSRAVVAAAGPGETARDVIEHPGLGLEGRIGSRTARLGQSDWAGGPEGAPGLWFARDGEAAVEIPLRDAVQAGTSDALNRLSARGIGVEILSGDSAEHVREIAASLGVSDWQARVSPTQKADRLKALEADGRRTLMVGDGLNDAGALALAHASLAPGGAMDVSQLASDAVYTGGGIGAVPFILATARTARARMRQNFALAALYNLVAVPIAVMGWVTPLIAAIAMSASSVVVTLNALRPSGQEETA